jgi:hypothetical protein
MTQRDDFDDPTNGDYVNPSDLIGHLVLWYPTEHRQEVNTIHGVKDAVIADLVDLTDGTKYSNAMFLQSALIGTLKRNVGTGRPMLGTVAKGEAKKGQAAPYILVPGDDAQKDQARKYLASLKDEFSL